MFQFFSQWFQTLILVMILASLIEMLLPSRSMERYVRIVLSLTVLMAILGPVFNLLNHRWGDEQWFLDWYSRNGLVSAMSGGIHQEAERIQKIQQDQAIQLVKQGLQADIAREVEARFPVDVDQVSVQVEETDLKGEKSATIRSLEIQGRIGDAGGSPMQEEWTVQPVQIQISEWFSEKSQERPSLSSSSAANREVEHKLKEWLAENYQLDVDHIFIFLDG